MTARGPHRRLLAALCALVVVELWLVAAVTEPTSANWTDQEHTDGDFQAVTVAPPSLHACHAHGVLLNLHSINADVIFTPTAGDEMRWTVGRAETNMADIHPSRIHFTGPDHQGRHTASFAHGLLPAVLGDKFYIGAQTLLETGNPNSWTSVPAYTSFEWGLLGSGGDCDPNVPAPR